MAARNSVKTYVPGSYYHIYNRGVAKNEIFLNPYDYSTFLSYIKIYLTPKDTIGLNAVLHSQEAGYKEKYDAERLLALKNFYDEIQLLTYALMPNHFHLLIWQKEANSIDNFMNSLGTRYSCYFNRKNHRVGTIFQGVYKAVLVESEEQLLHLSRYIHLNPGLKSTLPTSLPEYLGIRKTSWIKTDHILPYFSRTNTNLDYSNFVKNYADLEPIAPFTLDLF